MKIKIPNNNLNEREYVINVIFTEFLGLEYQLEVGSKDYEIVLENEKLLIIKDHFFNSFLKDLDYLEEVNIPEKVETVSNKFMVEKDLIVIYGDNNLEITNENITCGIDIFASSFFMLTRWEEYVNKSRDSHDRFPGYESLAFKNNFLNRPIVNEYVEMLWNMLMFLGLEQKRKHREYSLCLTHDVDIPLKYPGITSGFREIVGDILKRKNFKVASLEIYSKTKSSLSART